MKREEPRDVRKAFGLKVRQLRLSAGLSQEELADRAALHRTYIGSVERGERNISLVNMAKIAHAIGLTLADLLSGVEDD